MGVLIGENVITLHIAISPQCMTKDGTHFGKFKEI